MMLEESGVRSSGCSLKPSLIILTGPNIAPQHLRCFAKMAKVYANHKFA
jgi:hypothetical protein